MNSLAQVIPGNKPNLSPSDGNGNVLNFYQTHTTTELTQQSANNSSEKKSGNRRSIIVLKGGLKQKSGPIQIKNLTATSAQ